jgi:hypothetical protein
MHVIQSIRGQIAAAALLASAALAAASVPHQFNFQGRLTGVNDPTVNLTVSLWDSSNGGNLLFQETHSGVPLANGVFSIRVGAPSNGVPDAVFAGPQVWLGVSVNGGAELPRTRVVAVPWAIEATSSSQLVVPGTSVGVVVPGNDGGVTFQNIDASTLGDLLNDSGILCSGTEETLYHRHEPLGPAYIGIKLDTNDEPDHPCDSVIKLYDDQEHLGMRLHSDRTNNAAELSMFMEDGSDLPTETVEILAANENTTDAGGRLQLRRANGTNQAVTTTVNITARQGSDPARGGQIELSRGDGITTVAISSTETSGTDVQGGAIALYDRTGTQTIKLDGEYGPTGNGRIFTQELQITGGSDLSEQFDVRASGQAVEPGLVVCIDPTRPGKLCVSTGAYDRRVAGVVSGAGGIKPGMLMGQEDSVADGTHAVALTGRVWTCCDASPAAIEPGDLLTSAAVAGHAMKVADYARAQGAIIGKAMTFLPKGERGLVLVLVNLQ